MFGKKKIGLVLGGGVARGIAHIGVLKVIEKYKIPIEYISATSSGAISGAAYAAGMEVRLIEEIGMRISWGKILRVAFFRPGFVSGEAIKDLIIKYVGDIKFSELKIPLALVATDLRNGEPTVIDRGKVAKAVAASSAFPGLFAPEEINQHFVVDGAISKNLPVDVVEKMGANFVIASDVIPSKPVHYLPKDPLQVFSRSLDIVLHQLSVDQRKKADILIEPQFGEDIYPFDLHRVKKLIAAGEAAAHHALRNLRRDYR
ncbi:MAG: patatin-like phospholipase family protein [Candidatus Margulisiibacteriota bacterium]